MYINIKKITYPHFLPDKPHQKLIQRQRYQKSNHTFTKVQKSQESINKKIPKKILKLKKLYQTSSHSKVRKKQPNVKKKIRIFFLKKELSYRSLTKHVVLQMLQDEKRKKVRNFLK